MARLFPLGSPEWNWRQGLSEFQLAVHDVARPSITQRKRAANGPNQRAEGLRLAKQRLAKLLRSDCELTSEDRTTLADYFEDKLKRKRGRPKGKASVVRLDWLGIGESRYTRAIAELTESGGKNSAGFRRRLIDSLETELRPVGDRRSLDEYLSRSHKRR